MSLKKNARIRFGEITADNLSDVCQLSNTLSENQKKCVASNAYSIAQAHYYPEKTWFKAIYLANEDTPIGFIMVDTVANDIPLETRPSVFLWRFMIAKAFQKQGYGKEALDLISELFRVEGKEMLYTSCVMAEAEGPYPFYLDYGFLDTGVEEDGEQVLKFNLRENYE